MSSPRNEIDHDQIAELLGVYALDALDPDEMALVEEHLKHCPRCSEEVARHHQVAGLLANSGTEAPPQIWDRIAEKLGAPAAPEWEKLAARLERPPDAPVGFTDAPAGFVDEIPIERGLVEGTGDIVPIETVRRRNRFLMRGVSVVASAAAVLAIFLGIQVKHLNNQVNQLQALANKPLYTRAVQAALEEPTTKRITLTPTGASSGNGPSVTVALTSSGNDYLIAQNLSSLPSTETYQLWGQINGQFVSLGLLGSKPNIIPFTVGPNASVHLFAITEEPAGGVVQPTQTPVVQGVVNI